jgi:hypothetical protein
MVVPPKIVYPLALPGVHFFGGSPGSPVFVGYRIVKDQKTVGCLDNLAFDIFPGQFGWQAFSRHIAIERIVTEFLAVLSKICQRIIDLTDQ